MNWDIDQDEMDGQGSREGGGEWVSGVTERIQDLCYSNGNEQKLKQIKSRYLIWHDMSIYLLGSRRGWYGKE